MINTYFDPNNKSILKTRLLSAFAEKLPGFPTQCQLSILDRKSHEHAPLSAQKAAVLAILFWENEILKILYIKRTIHDQDKHSGQISFPGGRWENGDVYLKNTAIRETIEEVGITIELNDLVGSLTPLYIPVSNFLVHPFVAYLHKIPFVSKQDDEIDEIITFPVSELLNLEILYKDMEVRNRQLSRVPYFDIYGQTLWGATAMMSNELRYVLGYIKE